MKRLAPFLLVLILAAGGCGSDAPAAPTPSPASAPAATPDPRLSETRIRPADGAAMVYVPAGEFQMGSDYEETRYALALCKEHAGSASEAISTCGPSVFANEGPAHAVALDAFWMDRTEVTNGQYARCVDSGRCDPPVDAGSYTRKTYYGEPAYGDYPVVWVTQQQAADYCAWAEGRLPTEAEWEFAARGPESRIFPWGDTFDPAHLNYCDSQCPTDMRDLGADDGFADTAPVGSFPSGISWCGALDMAGNVREWVADWFGHYSAGRQENPAGPPAGTSRIPRGGCWLDRPDDARSANRGENAPDYTRHKVGFRCAADMEQSGN